VETTNADDDWKLITPEPIGGPVPPELATGNPDDDQLLMHIAAVASLDQPREWRHFLYAPDEESAQALARPLARSGIWDVEIYAPEDDEESYSVIACLPEVVLTADLVRSTRELFEDAVSLFPGTEYDGWEVSISADEYTGPGS
jgi:hypothetical protein